MCLFIPKEGGNFLTGRRSQVDMSAMEQKKPAKESQTEVEIPDDLLDFD
jgi:hypothetical protein